MSTLSTPLYHHFDALLIANRGEITCRIIEAAHMAGAETVLPGYRFLPEIAEFTRRCAEAGIVFVGPTAEKKEAMGFKSDTKCS